MRTEPTPISRLFNVLPGVLFVAAGLVLLAATVIMPSWIENQQLAWQRSDLQHQSQQLLARRVVYEDYIAGLKAKDPQLLRRVAFHYFSLKPQGAHLLNQRPASITDARWAHPGNPTPPAPFALAATDEWLGPPPQVQPLPPWQPPNTRLVRWTTGPMRFLTIALAIVCLLIGLLMRDSDDEPEADLETVPQRLSRRRTTPRE